jgi:hypothetical protein
LKKWKKERAKRRKRKRDQLAICIHSSPNICAGYHVFSHASFWMDQLIWKLRSDRYWLDISMGSDWPRMGYCGVVSVDSLGSFVASWSRICLALLSELVDYSFIL